MARNEREPRKLVTLRGMITPVETDYGDQAVGVTLITDDYEEHPVAPYGAGEELLELVDEYVEITGFLTDEEGEEMLVVREFRVVDAPEGGDEDRSTDDGDDDFERSAG